MMFHEKLNFLMNLTKTTNIALALYTSLDASHISRLRRGERGLPKKENYVQKMAAYFSKRCAEEYQKKALQDALNIGKIFFDNSDNLADIIRIWLLDQIPGKEKSVNGFPPEITQFQFKKLPSNNDHDCLIETEKDVTSIYYGWEGKQNAALRFLALVISQEKPQTLLLFSDESFEWISENHGFADKWGAMMSKVIMQGNKVKIIHVVKRNLDEMLAGIAKWIPLYVTGSIEPYYCPKMRDGIFKRTLFIAPETAAVISTSVGNMEDKAAHFLVRDKEAVKAITMEYNNFLALCKPLMRIFTPVERREYLAALSDFETEIANTIIRTETLSILTMPEAVANGIIARMKSNQAKEFIADIFRSRTKNFNKGLLKNKFTEIITLPNIDLIKAAKVKVAFSDMFSLEDLYYTASEFRMHLENIIMLMKSYDNYCVYIDADIKNDGYMLYAREDIGALVAKNSTPTVVFAINESNLTIALWNHLSNKINSIVESDLNRINTIRRLQSLIDDLLKD